MGPLGYSEPLNPRLEATAGGRWASEGSVKGLDLILSPGGLGTFRRKSWIRHPRSCWGRGRELARSKPFQGLGMDSA